MNTYQIEPYGGGWFRVTFTTPKGGHYNRDGFVSEFAARKWVEKSRRAEARQEAAATTAKDRPVSH